MVADSWHRLFAVGIVAKGADGLLELVGGTPLLVATPSSIRHVVALMMQEELSEDPGDLVATRLVRGTGDLTYGTPVFGAPHLFVHGLVKVALVMALLRNKLWA